jgi:hypothetical protein
MLAATIIDAIPTYPRGVCDGSLAYDLRYSLRSVRQVTMTLSLVAGFSRCPAHCPECGKQGHVIRSGAVTSTLLFGRGYGHDGHTLRTPLPGPFTP